MPKFTGKTPEAKTAPHVFSEHAEAKCTWTCHKSYLMQKFTGRPRASQTRTARFVRACAAEMHMDMSQAPFYAENYK